MVSALARANVDPWDEATRLSAMPRALAEKALVATLDLIPGPGLEIGGSENDRRAIGPAAPAAGRGRTGGGCAAGVVKQKSYWWLWVAFVIAISATAPRHPAATTDADVATSQSSASPEINSAGGDAASPSYMDVTH
jgi:hypothetical protein